MEEPPTETGGNGESFLAPRGLRALQLVEIYTTDRQTLLPSKEPLKNYKHKRKIPGWVPAI